MRMPDQETRQPVTPAGGSPDEAGLPLPLWVAGVLGAVAGLLALWAWLG